MKAPKVRNKQPDFVRKAGPHRDRTQYRRGNKHTHKEYDQLIKDYAGDRHEQS